MHAEIPKRENAKNFWRAPKASCQLSRRDGGAASGP